MAESPTSRTLKLYRTHGYQCSVVEHWNPHMRIRQDMFGCIDIVALGQYRTIGLQACAASGHSARVKKVCAEERMWGVFAAGWEMYVISWRKNAKNRWQWRHTMITVDQLTTPKPDLAEIIPIMVEGPPMKGT